MEYSLRKTGLMLPIPAPNGVFMATLCSERRMVNVRIFLCDSQLSERQLALKEKLARAMRTDKHALIECVATELRVPEASFALSMVLSRVARISQAWLGPVMTRITRRDDRHKIATSITVTLAICRLDDSLRTLYDRVALGAVSVALRKPDADAAALMRVLATEAKKMQCANGTVDTGIN